MESYFIFLHCYITVQVLGITGNILVIMSILKQKKLLKNNYYFLVLQLAINDLAVLIIYLLDYSSEFTLEKSFYDQFLAYRLCYSILFLFQVTGIGIMLFISVIRYRAAIHPLKPALSRRKMKNVCRLVYIFGLIASYGPARPLYFIHAKDILITYEKFYFIYVIICYYIFPTFFMSIVYYKICRELIQQSKRMKNLCSNPLRQRTPNSSFNIMTFIRNKRTSLVSFCTVLCYGVGNIPMTVTLSFQIIGKHHLILNNLWVLYFANVFRVFSSNVVNPLIYGTLDKKLVCFWKRKSLKMKTTRHGN